ncbi:MAG: replication restart helicase PriA [Thermoguttaceae bacterium]|jgi:primosomal protein N' (replication factor Y)
MADQTSTFFNPENPVWELYDPKREIFVARVAFVDGLDGVFDYQIPDRLRDRVLPGVRVQVPLGRSNRLVLAYCVKVERRDAASFVQSKPAPKSKESPKRNLPKTPTFFALNAPDSDASTSPEPEDAPQIIAADSGKTFKLKAVQSVVDPKPLLSPKILKLGLELARRSLSPIGATLDGIIPAGVRGEIGSEMVSVCELAPDAAERLKELQTKRGKREALTPKQLFVLDELRKAVDPPTMYELARMAKCSTSPITTLRKYGLIRMKRIKRSSRFYDELASAEKKSSPATFHELNADQQRALDSILGALREGRSETFVLHGVTGSGKTEVYIDAIKEVVSYGKQAIVLVPEISLTPQTVQRFRAQLGDVAVLHSRLTDLERRFEWDKIESGQAQVVVGARSAIFAPCSRLGLVVIDEEHETSFKQNVVPRYHARVVAKMRAKQDNAILVLGSATPSLETWRNVQLGTYKLLSLPKRVRDLPQPPIYVVDMRDKLSRGSLCQRLSRDIEGALDADPTNQVVLLLNRRGFATHIQCPHCGEVLKCPNCDVSLTHHITQNIAICHYCDYQIPAPRKCPHCGLGIKYSGVGTQKLEQELTRQFPNAPVLRMDSDTTQARNAHERGLAAFRRGEYRILLGTQMIAKGLDFPNVVLVGIVNVDAALQLPDFRAEERTFNLILQASGRAGRGDKEGKVVVQTYSPDHEVMRAAVRGDYPRFVKSQLANRRMMGYPPFTSAIRIIVRGPDQQETFEVAQRFAKALRDAIYAVNLEHGYDLANPPLVQDASGGGAAFSGRRPKRPRPPLVARVVGPAPAPFAKLRGLFRFHMQLFGAPGALLRDAAERLLNAKLKCPAAVQWIIDVDPLDAL